MPELFSHIERVLEFYVHNPAAIVPTLIFVLYVVSLLKSVFGGSTQSRKPQATNYQRPQSPQQPGFQPPQQQQPQQTYQSQQPQQPYQPQQAQQTYRPQPTQAGIQQPQTSPQAPQAWPPQYPAQTGGPPLQPGSQRPPQYTGQQVQQYTPPQAREQLGQRALGDQAAVSAGLQQAPQYTPLQAREQLGQRDMGAQASGFTALQQAQQYTPLQAREQLGQRAIGEEAAANARPQFSIQAGQRPAAPVGSSTQALQQLRAQSDAEAAKTLEATTAESLIAQAALRPARAELTTLLGRGDPKRGALVTALVLSQVLDRRRPRHRQMPTPPASQPSTK